MVVMKALPHKCTEKDSAKNIGGSLDLAYSLQAAGMKGTKGKAMSRMDSLNFTVEK
jgi:hypothetical protein